jgi:isoleucyl-tRNA synthetase
VSDKKLINDRLESGMTRLRHLVEVGRSLRSKIGIKVRYPLSNATIVCDKEVELSIKDLLDLLNEEINVKKISFSRNTSQFIIKTVKPNHSSLGPKYKDKAKNIVESLENMDKNKLYDDLIKNKEIFIESSGEKIKLNKNDFEVIEQEKPQYARTEIDNMILFVDTTITPELEAEGFAREIVRRIQSMRKELDLDVEDKILTEISVNNIKKDALQAWKDYIRSETRSEKISFVDKPKGQLIKNWKIDDLNISIGIRK